MKGLQSEMIAWFEISYIGTQILWMYQRCFGCIRDVEEISVDILTKKSIRQKLFKIHKNIQKNSKKNDQLNKNTYFNVIF